MFVFFLQVTGRVWPINLLSKYRPFEKPKSVDGFVRSHVLRSWYEQRRGKSYFGAAVLKLFLPRPPLEAKKKKKFPHPPQQKQISFLSISNNTGD